VPAASGITSTLAWTLLNSGIALIGYYFSAWLIDDINWGRYRIQVCSRNMPTPCMLPVMFVHRLDKATDP